MDLRYILIVDDDPGFRALVASLLQRAGYATLEAATGEEALAKARVGQPSCILLDVLLPGVSGYEVCRELRDEFGEALPIIFVTGERTAAASALRTHRARLRPAPGGSWSPTAGATSRIPSGASGPFPGGP
jgi:CheY-like chemotaxis protein